MSFTIAEFLFLGFSVFFAIYYLLLRGKKTKKLTEPFLLVTSLAVYSVGAGWKTGLLLALTCLLTKWAGDLLFHSHSRLRLAVFITLALCPLFLFKYLNFLLGTLNTVLHTAFSAGDWAAPLGISFITFSVLSYLIDVYRGEEPGSILSTGLYVLFFPKILSGPIVRWKEFRQKWALRCVSVDLTEQGVRRLMMGFIKRAVLADSFGVTATMIGSSVPNGVDAPSIVLMGFCMMFQIYFDFSGYSDIALGLSNMLGVSWKENFHFPYLSTSVSDFWRRWHISLGSWFREYVYIPLGGNRRGNVYVNLFIVFALTGIWHGARWNMVLWGCLNGLAVMAERKIARQKRSTMKNTRCGTVIRWLFTMVFVYFSWMLFMAPNLGQALQYGRILLFSPYASTALNFTWQYFLTPRLLVLLSIAGVGSVLPAIVPSGIKEKLLQFRKTIPGYWIESALLFVLLVLAALFMINASYSPFLYFQY